MGKNVKEYKSKLYLDTTTGEVKTYKELMDDYIQSTNSKLAITNEVMELIIMSNLIHNGGTIQYIDDEIIAWCNDFSDYNEAERYYTKDEIDSNVKHYYECICSKDNSVESWDELLVENEEGLNLLRRLHILLEGI